MLILKFQLVSENYCTEGSLDDRSEMNAILAEDVSYQEKSEAVASRSRISVDGVCAEKNIAMAKVNFFFI